jgi:membrane protease YdiL (CAAX protease family)
MSFFSPHALSFAHGLAILLIVGGPLVSYFYERPRLRKVSNRHEKIGFYRYLLLVQWPAAAAAVCIFSPERIVQTPAIAGLGLSGGARMILGAALAAFFILGLMPFFQSLRGERFRAAYARAYHRSLGPATGLLPESNRERLWFAAVAVTAGVCEEILFRGFLIRYLAGGAMHLPLSVALALSAAIFGLNHIYLGRNAILTTALGGLAFGATFLLTGNLLLPILLHTAFDMQTVFVFRKDQPTVE